MRILSPIQHCGRPVRSVGAILIALLWPGTFVQAGPVSINEVIQIISNHQHAPDLRLRALTQIGNTAISSRPAVDGSHNKQATNAKPAATDSLFSGADFQTNQKPTTVVVISQGDVEGTICDCGEILVAGGGFPKWPLLFLAAIPFFFIDSDDDARSFISTPIPTPPPSATPPIPPPPGEIPEPASLMLFGSGLLALGAGFRRRSARIKAAASAQGPEGI